MSFKLKRRDSEGASPDAPKTDESKKKYPVGGYIALLFAVVIVLVVMSYFAQQRNHNITLDSLLQQQDSVTSQAFANIEKLQDSNMALMGENEDLKVENDNLKDRIEALNKEKEALESSNSAVRAEKEALKALLSFQTAVDSGDIAKAESQKEAVKNSALPQEYKAKFDALCAELELLKNPPVEDTETEKEEE